jgi:hypothetical protein
MQRRQRTEQAIERGDVAELLSIVEFKPCACKGAEADEPLCCCRMSAKQVREAVSYAGLKRGKLVWLITTPDKDRE